MVRAEVSFWQDTLLKKMKSRWNQVPGSSCSVGTLGGRDRRVSLEIIQSHQLWDSLVIDFGRPVCIPGLAICGI